MNEETFEIVMDLTQRAADSLGVSLSGGGPFSSALNQVRALAKVDLQKAHPDDPKLFEEEHE